MTKKIFLLTATFSFSLINSTRADEPLISDRPDFTESTESVPPGRLQIESGITFSRAGDARSNSFGEVLIRKGLNQRTELRLEAPSYVISRTGGQRTSNFEDGSLGFKVVLSPGSEEYGFRKPRVSFIGSTSLPLGSREARGSGIQPEGKLLLGVDLSERFSLSSNLNAAYLKDEAGRFHEFSGSVSLGASINESLGAFFEAFAFLPGGDRGSSKYFNTGLTYLVNDDLQLDTRVGIGLNNHVGGPDHFFGVGLARRF